MPRPSYEPSHCVVCGRADDELLADADAMRVEIEALWAYHESRLRPGTPPPRLMDRVAFSEHPPFRLVQCRSCGLVYRNPVERSHELAAIYGRATLSCNALRSLHDTQRPSLRRQARTLRNVLGRGGSGLEVGSYVGAFLGAARDEGLQFEGLDINADASTFARSLGYAVHDGELSSFETNRLFDAVAIWNTFDQLADPRGALYEAWRLLRPGGVLALRVPNGGFYAAARRAMRRSAPGVGAAARAALAQNNLLTFPYRWGFTPRALTRLVEAVGFTVERLRGDVLVPIADEWTRPWARVEEVLIKAVLAGGASLRTDWSPWFELYARRPTSESGRAV